MPVEDMRDLSSADARWTSMRVALVRAVRRQCARWLSDHAEDLAQAALLKIMVAANTGEGNRTLSSFYLHRVAHSALVDEIRRRQRRREVSLVDDDPDGDRSGRIEPRADADPERDASMQEVGVAVRDCLLAMGADRRQAVMLHLQGHSVPETARLLGWPHDTGSGWWASGLWRRCGR